MGVMSSLSWLRMVYESYMIIRTKWYTSCAIFNHFNYINRQRTWLVQLNQNQITLAMNSQKFIIAWIVMKGTILTYYDIYLAISEYSFFKVLEVYFLKLGHFEICYHALLDTHTSLNYCFLNARLYTILPCHKFSNVISSSWIKHKLILQIPFWMVRSHFNHFFSSFKPSKLSINTFILEICTNYLINHIENFLMTYWLFDVEMF
jgi:hypothetical protein